MADELVASGRVHQLLHGYSDGHRFLAGSIRPEGNWGRTLLILSDASGPNLPTDERGYLTGYPILEAKSYALARTWAAPEQSRPGCVWTHTLLVDFSDLAAISDPSELLKLFRRPSVQPEVSEYNRLLHLPHSVGVSPSLRITPPLILRALFSALYGSPEESIILSPSDDFDAESWTLAIWAQQWPRLRRTFRFCTLSLADRSTLGALFDLQVVPERTGGVWVWRRGRYVGGQMSDHSREPDWVLAAIQDLVEPAGGPFRKFMWQFGADAPGRREFFVPLAEVFLAAERPSDDVRLDKLIGEFQRSASEAPALTRYFAKLIIRSLLQRGASERTALAFLVSNLDIIGGELEERDAEIVGRVILTQEPNYLKDLVDCDNPAARSITSSVAKQMTPAQAIAYAGNDPPVMLALVNENPRLAASPDLWKSKVPLPERILGAVKRHPEVGREVTDSMIAGSASGLAKEAVEAFGSAAIEAIISRLDMSAANVFGALADWARCAAKSKDLLCQALLNGVAKRISTLATLSTFADYRQACPNADLDPWVAAISAIGREPETGGVDLCVFLLSRALSKVSSQPGRLIALSFDTVYAAASRSALDYASWRMLRDVLPASGWWVEWDKCLRLRSAVATMFVAERLPPTDFLQVTKEDYVFERMVDAVLQQVNGGEYLGRVVAHAADTAISKNRRRILTRALP